MQAFHDGLAFDAYTWFGAHPTKRGVRFCTWAPEARRVAVIGEWNGWKPQPMRREGADGVWKLVCQNAEPGMLYKYQITGAGGAVADHCDPYGFAMELRPASASRIVGLGDYRFGDAGWMARRSLNYDTPMNIYELHFGSWRQNPGDANGWFRYADLADDLTEYLLENHYTHVEFMPLSEHPADESWGYQNTGFFAPTSRYGAPDSLRELIDRLHRAGIGAIIDFVPVHFALDGYALAWYDGTELYEYPHSDVSLSEWGTLNFNHARREVASFLQSAANYWLTEFHFDGIRMDAISRGIYWQGDPARGVNPNGVNFFKTMNHGLHRLHPTAMLIAEDSTAYPKITAAVEYDGLGFNYKWDLGWMNDTLDYFRVEPLGRGSARGKLEFSMRYFYNELYLLPFSHDEVVHGKATIIQKMWGSYEQKFPQCRALYLYMTAHPGKKLNFMGNETAQFREWTETREPDWDLLRYPLHDAFHHYIMRLNELYLQLPALHAGEYDPRRFEWLTACEPTGCVFVFRRGTGGGRVAAAFNFSDVAAPAVPVRVAERQQWRELINSDWDVWGGGTPAKPETLRAERDPQGWGIALDLAPFSGRLFAIE